jgi:hypothetical protein
MQTPQTPSRAGRIARALLVLLLAAVAGCKTASIYSPDVQLHLAVEPAQVRAGDSLRLEFTVTNPQPDTVVLEFAEDCRVTLVVMDASQRAAADQRCMTPGGGRLVLPAGGTWKASGGWRAAADGGTPMAAGSYMVRAVLGEHASLRRGRREFKMSHAADTVAFRVLPADGP